MIKYLLKPDEEFLEEIIFEKEQFEYNYNKIKENKNYYELLSEVLRFISGNMIEFYNFHIKLESKPVSIDFMNWFLKHTNELKRKLNIGELIELESKYNLTQIFKKEVNSLKQLNNYNNLNKLLI